MMITDSCLRKDKNHQPRVFLEKCIIKEKDDRWISPSDDSDEEISDGFDKETCDQ